MPALWIPPTAREPMQDCAMCGGVFPKRRIVSHLRDCSRRHRDEIAEQTVGQQQTALDGALDQEAWNWGRRRAAEGKVGFKHGRPA